MSDSSLEELHEFAELAGIPARGFDLDHYDVPAELHERLRELGAREVSNRELIKILRSSGLRVPARDRSQ